ncbi:MAG: nitroreductase [Marinosulfonomonas sp.]|nr:nitroreductase [Marinosulfonomonas sp.]
MTKPDPAVMTFLLTRRSRPYKTLTTPVPDRNDLMPLLTAAARVPDHGKLEPWRFIVLTGAALTRLGDLTKQRGAALGIEPDKIDKAASTFANAGLVVAVVASPEPSDKIPAVEQIYSAGAVCLSLLNAALASGWGANWLSGWPSHDRTFLSDGLALTTNETIAGFIHIGRQTSAPPERPRPTLETITEWVSA